jgi:SAM-dependent methyltransferase
VDVIISNCVINLSGDKRQVLKEAFRVLKPGGRFAVSDVITRAGLPEAVKENMALWTGCVAGALEEQQFIALLEEAGFEDPSIEPTRIYSRDDAAALLQGTGLDESLADQVEGKIISGFVRATKPGVANTSLSRDAKPFRQLASLGAARSATRECGCDDGCCT